MNVDLLINKYYLIVNELEQKEKSERKEKLKKQQEQNLPDNKQENRWRRLLLLGFIVAFVVLLFGLYLFKNLVMILLSFAFFVFFGLVASYMSSREQAIKDWIDYNEKHEEKRIKELRKLLIQYGLTIDKSTIDTLIAEAKANKPKYGLLILSNITIEKKETADLSAKFVALIGAIVSLLLKVINVINDGASELDGTSTDTVLEIANAISPSVSEVYAVIQLLLWIALLLVALLLLCFCYKKDIDPLIRKRYYFHDVFVEDLKNLLLFNVHYKEKILVVD